MNGAISPNAFDGKIRPVFLSFLILFIFFLPCILYFNQIFNDTPYFDEWRTVPDAVKIARGDWSFSYLFFKEQGHPALFYRASTLIDALFFSYTLRPTVMVGFIFLFMSALFISYIAASRREVGWGSYLIACVGIYALMFSLHNWENILAPWLINSASLLFCFIVATYFASVRGVVALFLSLIFAVLSSLAFGNGFLVWICCIFIFLAHRMFVRAGVFSVLGALSIYYVMTNRGSLGEVINLGNAALRLLSAVGNTLSFSPAVVSSTGPISATDVRLLMATGLILIVVVCLVAFLVRRNMARSSFAISLILFGLGSCALVAVGRSSLSVEQAASSRYYFSALPIMIGVVLVFLDLSEKQRWATFALSGCVALIFASYIVAFRAEMATGPYRKLVFDRWAKVVENYRSATDAELANPHWPPTLIRSLSQSLSDAKLGPFSAIK